MPGAGGPRRQATLATLAASLKVSRTTVSNAYNRPDQLSPALRERVLREAARLGYPGPDPVARSLRTRKAGAVGLLLTEALSYAFRDPAAVSFLAGLSEACEAAGQGLLLVPAHPGRDRTEASQAVLSAGVDGFVVYSVAEDDPYLAAVLRRGVPTVICDQPDGLDGVDRVGIDDRAAVRELAEHLITLGHRHFGVLCMRLGRDRNDGPASTERWRGARFHVQRERLEGLSDALSAAGLDLSEMPVVERFDHLVEQGQSAAAEALDADPGITALVCTTDVLALGALREARRRGLDVPGQLTVTGFDGVPQALAEGLTTVLQPVEEKGRAAGRLLLEPREAGVAATPRTVLLPTTLELGRTSSSPQQPKWFSGL
ncbi:LacI family DNA-binding transcriptional regulator [Rhodococcus antarcticus]|jgi:DNA-binding LacI/PurR family transcriptional regulator|uniref:LacI family DNA-binding transcriptional regulator n=1 Tax=Rhodococcus antarcticus TaxID=2987751 RepID=A0ABY6NYC5_9NOCA|nr:LacI family DNA-binding transcriptional regulator [Rhodococcus antarcticus]UZJ24390.1 LacI family DNA-binding transcriptional regulator [Rhodococcus antarcticus]